MLPKDPVVQESMPKSQQKEKMPLPSDFNPVGFIYLNPEFNVALKDAAETYERHSRTVGSDTLYYSLSSAIPDNFDASMFLACHRGALNISPLNKLIGMTEDDGASNTHATADTIMENATCSALSIGTGNAAAFDFINPGFCFDTNLLSVGDELVIEVPGIGETHVLVTATNNGHGFHAMFQSPSHMSNGGLVLVRGHRLHDIERLARINVVRGYARADAADLDGEFNGNLYRLLYPDARHIAGDVELWNDYMRRQNAGDFRICKVQQLSCAMHSSQQCGPDTWTSNVASAGMRTATWCSNMLATANREPVSVAPCTPALSLTPVMDGIMAGGVALKHRLLVSPPECQKGIAVDVEGSIRARDYLVASDARLKTDVTDLSVSECARAIANIAPVRYRYVKEERELHYGFLAQQLQEQDRNLVRVASGFLPSIRREVDVGRFGEVHLPDHGLSQGAQLQLHHPTTGNEHNVIVRQVIDKDNIVLNDMSLSSTKMLVYGSHANDILHVNTGNLLAVLVGAVKEIMGRLDAMEARLAEPS